MREVRALGRLMRAGGDVAVSNESNGASVEEVAGFVITSETMAQLSSLDPLACITRVRRAYVVPRDDVASDMAVVNRLTERGVEVERAVLPGYGAMMVASAIAKRALVVRTITRTQITPCRTSHRQCGGWSNTPA